MMPALPVMPEFPSLSWELGEDGRYSISTEDADLLLDWRDNGLALYSWELGVYSATVEAVLEGLRAR